MKKRKIAVWLLLPATVLSGCAAPVAEAEETSQTSQVLSIDPDAIRAQDDFYGYINARELMDINLEESEGEGGAFYEVQQIIDERTDAIIDEITGGDRNSYAPGSNEQLIYDIYYQALEASNGGNTYNDDDLIYIDETAQSIMDAQSIDELLDVCGEMYIDWGVNPLFVGDVNADQNNSSQGSILILPFSDPAGAKAEEIIWGGYVAQNCATMIRGVLTDYGIDYDEAQERSLEDARMVIDIAMGTDLELMEVLEDDWAESMNCAIYKTNDEIDELCPNIGIEGIMKTIGLESNPVDGVYLWDEGQLELVDSLLTEENLNKWKDIVLLAFITQVRDYMPAERGGYPVLYSNDLYARNFVNYQLSEQMGEEYAERYLDEQTVEDVTRMTQDLVDEYTAIINECEWLSDEGKSAIIAKLNNMAYFIGAPEPHEVDPNDAYLVGSSLCETMRNLNNNEYDKKISKLTDGIERNGFNSMPPQIVNACYMPDINSINITLAIMSEPFYSPDNTYWENLGGIGAVVGHEISHAFDNHGMLFDMNGNYNPDWMPQEDRDAFDTMAQHISDYYSTYTILQVHPIDGELTLGENLADISGVECILRIAQNNDQRQQILESYARIWSELVPKDTALMLLVEDVHSPASVRVNAVVSLFDCFYEIYDVQEGDGMYVAPEDRVRRW